MKTYDPSALEFDPQLARRLQRDLVGEILKAVRLPLTDFFYSVIGGLVALPTRRFAQVMADFDRVIGESGLRFACVHLLDKLVSGVHSVGSENIPAKGPVLIASNHPGTFDAVAIASQLPREDVRIIVGANPFFYDLPNGRDFLIFATRKQNERFAVIRQAVHHLQEGGLLIIFPYGHISPDPSVLSGAQETIQRWSSSLEIFFKKVPDLKLILTVTSGVLTREYIHHPLPSLFKDVERRRIIEFMQIIKQMLRHQKKEINPKISFAPELRHEHGHELGPNQRLASVIAQELDLLKAHMQLFYPAGS